VASTGGFYVKEFVFPENERYLRSRVGNMSALAGAVRYTMEEGQAAGTSAVDVRTGSGLEFTVLPGRGMDISRLSFRGVPLSYLSKSGVIAASRYESRGIGWLRGFFGGLLTTCGLSNVGPPSSVNRGDPLGWQDQGLHGRISNITAEQMGVRTGWSNGVYQISVSGLMRESMAFGESLTLRREIGAVAGVNSFTIIDVVENDSPTDTPFMLLYHINGGYPLVNNGAQLVTRSSSIISREEPESKVAMSELMLADPVPGAPERCYFHELVEQSDGTVSAAIINPERELGLYVKYRKLHLPYFTSWLCPAAQDYAMGMEPATTLPIGYENAAARNMVDVLSAFGRRQIELEIGVLEDREAIQAFGQ